MEVTLKQADLVRELGYAQGVVEKKSTMAILSNVLLQADTDGVFLTATDLEVSLKARLNAAVDQAGAVTLSGKTLFDVARSATEDLLLKLEGDQVAASSGQYSTHLPSLPKDDFPQVQDYDFASAYTLPTKVLKGLIARTLYSVAQEETRFSVRGALFVFGDGKAAMVATDGHRLSLADTEVTDGPGESVQVLLHKKALAELTKLCDGENEEVLFGQKENHVFFKLGERVLVSRLMDVTFPSYEKVIPTDNDKTVVVERELLLQSLRRVCLLASEKSKAVKFSFNGEKLELSTVHSERGDAKDVVPCTYGGEELNISFNGQYVIDFLNSVQTPNIQVSLKSEKSQGLFEPVDDDYRYRCVIMPMRL